MSTPNPSLFSPANTPIHQFEFGNDNNNLNNNDNLNIVNNILNDINNNNNNNNNIQDENINNINTTTETNNNNNNDNNNLDNNSDILNQAVRDFIELSNTNNNINNNNNNNISQEPTEQISINASVSPSHLSTSPEYINCNISLNSNNQNNIQQPSAIINNPFTNTIHISSSYDSANSTPRTFTDSNSLSGSGLFQFEALSTPRQSPRKLKKFDNVTDYKVESSGGFLGRFSNHFRDPLGENLYTAKDVGWNGWKTIHLIGERYLFGLLVAVVVSFFVFILSLPEWTAPNTRTGFNHRTYNLFMIFGSVLFTPAYVLGGIIISYGLLHVRKSNVLFYGIGISAAYVLLYVIFMVTEFEYWYYYIDIILIIVIYLTFESLFVYLVSCSIQKAEMVKNSAIDKTKAWITSFNYSAPDIIVTIFTVIYMFFLLPVYFSIQNDLIRLGWRLVVHPIYWMAIVTIARQFLTRDISAEDIMLNSNIVLHTYFHHQTLGRIFVYTFGGDSGALTEIGMIISAVEDIIIRCLSLYRDEWVVRIFHGKERAYLSVYSQQNLQLRSAILNIQVGLEFSGLFTAPLFIFLFQKHRLVFHFFDDGHFVLLTLFYQTCLSIGLDLISEVLCTFVECRIYNLPLVPTWKWVKENRTFMIWLVYGSISMGFFAMVYTCARVPRAFLCSSDNICSCNSIIASSLPQWC